ncbi:class I SAM-dependent methyltransferase [Sulfuricurvum sp.]|uniref:class I SAM-dependent methyltransferase n=1 Tax=Sulfuricurvum sp. TaxID=2025608 RepID=UPI0026381228|nr:class I SAM-dependent methyltransferase [Sulfuricurvum sp.]MDD3598064.1 class I SAM-dependent methyltransferase [Sulfuricurvum sp.]
MSSQTQQFYEQNSHDLIKRYESADMSVLHQLLVKHIPLNSKVIDIGFGSGRDLAFLQSKGHDIYGIDPVKSFIVQSQHRFMGIHEHFRVGTFLSSDIPLDWLYSFDVVISIAVWMHLKADESPKAIETIKSFLKPNGIVILSFSLGARDKNDERHFELLSIDSVVNEFLSFGFKVVQVEKSSDTLGRESIEWATIVFQAVNENN